MAEQKNAEKRTTWFSVRRPVLLVVETDFTPWIQRVELYMKVAKISDEMKGQEHALLLEDGTLADLYYNWTEQKPEKPVMVKPPVLYVALHCSCG